MAEVDSTSQVEESEEGNNQGREKLVPRCAAVESQAGLESKGQGKGEAGGPGRIGVKGLSPVAGLARREGAGDDGCGLALEELALSGEEVVAVLFREGAERVEAGEVGRLQLEVRAWVAAPDVAAGGGGPRVAARSPSGGWISAPARGKSSWC